MSFDDITFGDIRKRRASHLLLKASREARRNRANGYKVIAVSLYNQQAEAVERAIGILRRAGYINASRSFIIQAVIERCLEGRAPAEIVRFFEERGMNLHKPRLRKK